MQTEGIIISQTPFRLSYFGGGTDFPGYFNEHGGMVIAAAIDKYLYVTINSLKRFYEKRIRLSYSQLEFVDHPEELSHSIVKAILTEHQFFSNENFLDMHTYADFPASSGMGSSSVFTVGFLQAFYALYGKFKTAEELATEAIYIEREKIKEAGGWQDQITPAYGGLNCIRFNATGFTVEPILLPFTLRRDFEAACVLFFTGGTRSSAEIQQHSFNMAQVDKIKHLDTINQQARQALEIFQRASDSSTLIHELGNLLNISWAAKRNLSQGVSNARIDAMYETALKNGAIGGKLCGAGGDGFLLTLVDPKKKQKLIEAMTPFKYLDIQFDDVPSRIVYGHRRKV
jgi:D-glycero-alpha-D-manno-heptose-7-phosphate kinase